MLQKNVIFLGASGFVGSRFKTLYGGELSPGFIGTNSRDFDLSDYHQSRQFLKNYLSTDTTVILNAGLMPYAAVPKDSLATMQKNIQFALVMAQILEEFPVTEVILISSVDVYGGSVQNPITELSPTSPQSHYAATKLCGEILLRTSCSRNQIPILTLRPSQIFGCGDNSPKFISSCIKSAIQERQIKIAGDGKDTRDYLYVDDLCRILRSAISRKLNETLNVVSGVSTSIYKAASIIADTVGSDVEVNLTPSPKTTSCQEFDNRRLRDHFSLPFTPIEEALKATIRYSNSAA